MIHETSPNFVVDTIIMNKLNIILYGRRNTGKTTALIKLVKLLVNNPAVSTAIDAVLKNRNGRFKDARFLLDSPYGIIIICTAGDTWTVSDQNCDLFKNSLSGKIPVYFVNSSGIVEYNGKTIRSFFDIQQVKVCVCACQPSGDNDGAIKALHYYSENHLMHYDEQRWIKAVPRDSTANANELFQIITNF